MRCFRPTKIMFLLLAALLVLNLSSLAQGVSAVNRSSDRCRNFESADQIPQGFLQVSDCEEWNLREEASDKIAQARKLADNKKSGQLLNQSVAKFSAGDYEAAISLADRSLDKAEGGLLGGIGSLVTGFVDYRLPFLPDLAGIPHLLLLAVIVIIIVATVVHIHHYHTVKLGSVAPRSDGELEEGRSRFGSKQLGKKEGEKEPKRDKELEEELQALSRALDIFISKKETKGGYTGQERDYVEESSRLMRDIESEIEEGSYDEAKEDLNLLADRIKRLVG